MLIIVVEKQGLPTPQAVSAYVAWQVPKGIYGTITGRTTVTLTYLIKICQ